MGAIDASGIRKIFDMAAALKDPVNLGIGQPHFDVPKSIKDEADRQMRGGFNAYTPTQGIPELITALKKEIRANKGREPEDLFITSGVSGAINLLMQALLDPGDEIILTDPYFVIYQQTAAFIDAKAVYLDTYPDFRLHPERLEALITPKTKALVLNSPGNPTGMIYRKEEIAAAVDICRRHNVLIVMDEIYEIFNYEGGAFSPVPSAFGSYENAVLLGGFSKSFSMTGWRLGYAAGPTALIQEMKKLQQYTFVCAPSFAQKAAMKGFEAEARAEIAAHVADYKKKRDRVYETLKDLYEVERSEGAFYFFVKAPKAFPNATAFVEKAVSQGLLIIPGKVFSTRDTHFRMSFAADDRILDRGLELLKKLAKG